MEKTLLQYDEQLVLCRSLFLKKAADYGTAWRILRLSSITDQLFIKAQRIRTIEELGNQQIADDIKGEYMGLVNYGLMALIQMTLPADAPLDLALEEVVNRYDAEALSTRKLMQAKNHDYGEAWRQMRVSSLTDLILMKLLRIKQIEDHRGMTSVSEGVDANYRDLVNYSLFALIRLDEADSLS